jgi:hypothetical protein
MLRARLATLAAVCLALPACPPKEPAPAQQDAPAPAASDPAAPAAPADGKAAVADPAVAPTPAAPVADFSKLTRSEARMAMKVTVAADAGFRLEPLLKMYALAATPGRPPFAAPLNQAAKAQDDDLLSAATCSFGQLGGEACALGLVFPEVAEVTMLRLFLAAGPDYRDYVGAPRPRRVVIHTDVGKFEFDYPDGATDRYISFAGPVATAGLSIEILDVYHGRKEGALHFAEIEVYGTKGVARPPLALRIDETFVYFETQPWKAKGGGRHTVMMTWLERLGYEGPGERPSPRRRWIRGVAAYGGNDDRFVLVERGLSSTCEAAEVGYLLIDKQTRMIYPLGELAGGDATIYRHAGGLGFVAVPPDGDVAGMRSVVFDPAKNGFERRRPRKTWTVADSLREWGFDPQARRPGGRDLDAFVADPGSHCEVLAGDGLAAALARSEVFKKAAAPGEWWSCAIGDGHQALLGRDRACGEVVSIMLRTPDGTIVPRAEFRGGAGSRRIAVAADRAFPGLLVEVGKEEGAASDLVPVNVDFHDEPILRDASLAVRPPADCGACVLEYGSASDAVAAEPAPADTAEPAPDAAAEPAPDPGAEPAPEPAPDAAAEPAPEPPGDAP